MASTLGTDSSNIARELAVLDNPESALADAKKRVLRDLSTSRVWSDLIGYEVRVTSDERPVSLFRKVDFDYSEDTRGEPRAYRTDENGVDSDDPLSW